MGTISRRQQAISRTSHVCRKPVALFSQSLPTIIFLCELPLPTVTVIPSPSYVASKPARCRTRVVFEADDVGIELKFSQHFCRGKRAVNHYSCSTHTQIDLTETFTYASLRYKQNKIPLLSDIESQHLFLSYFAIFPLSTSQFPVPRDLQTGDSGIALRSSSDSMSFCYLPSL
jgi:hypothetical protein